MLSSIFYGFVGVIEYIELIVVGYSIDTKSALLKMKGL